MRGQRERTVSRGRSSQMTTRDTKDLGATKKTPISRRTLLKAGAGTAALFGALQTKFPGGVHIAQAAGPEVTKAILGYIALIDASPLVIAKEKGFFAKHGMPDVDVSKQASWGATRDNIVLGSEKQRHRRRAHPHADALPDLRRQGDAEQRADADVPDGSAQSRRPGDLGRARNTRTSRSPPTRRRSKTHSRRRRRPARK